MAFLYTIMNSQKKETKKTNLISIAITKIKYLGIKHLYSEKYRTLKKEIKEDTNKWKHILCSWSRKINIIKMFILPKATYRFNAISIIIPMAYFMDLKKILQKFIWKQKKPEYPQQS